MGVNFSAETAAQMNDYLYENTDYSYVDQNTGELNQSKLVIDRQESAQAGARNKKKIKGLQAKGGTSAKSIIAGNLPVSDTLLGGGADLRQSTSATKSLLGL